MILLARQTKLSEYGEWQEWDFQPVKVRKTKDCACSAKGSNTTTATTTTTVRHMTTAMTRLPTSIKRISATPRTSVGGSSSSSIDNTSRSVKPTTRASVSHATTDSYQHKTTSFKPPLVSEPETEPKPGKSDKNSTAASQVSDENSASSTHTSPLLMASLFLCLKILWYH